MDNGKIAEAGTYDELMSLGGKLTALVETYESETGTPRAQAKAEGDDEGGKADGGKETEISSNGKWWLEPPNEETHMWVRPRLPWPPQPP